MDVQTKLNLSVVLSAVLLLAAILACPYDPWSVVHRQLRQPTDRNATVPTPNTAAMERLYISLSSIDLCLDEVGCTRIEEARYLCSKTQSFWTAALVMTLVAVVDMLLYLVWEDLHRSCYNMVGRRLPSSLHRLVCGCQSKLMHPVVLVWMASLILVVNLAQWTTVCTMLVAPADQYVMVAQKTLPAQRAFLVVSGIALAVTCLYILHGSHLCCEQSFGNSSHRHQPIPSVASSYRLTETPRHQPAVDTTGFEKALAEEEGAQPP